MSYAREIGFAVQQVSQGHEPALCEALGLTSQELRRLYKGRLFLTGADLEKAAKICGVSEEWLLEPDPAEYEAGVVDALGGFTNPGNREMILDLIDAYIDAKEALARVCK